MLSVLRFASEDHSAGIPPVNLLFMPALLVYVGPPAPSIRNSLRFVSEDHSAGMPPLKSFLLRLMYSSDGGIFFGNDPARVKRRM